MKRELQKTNVIATLGAFLSAAVSFFFISFTKPDIISIANSSMLLVFTIALFTHGVILPVRGMKLDEKARKKVKVFLVLGMLFADDKLSYAQMYEDFTPDMVFKRTWSPWSMFPMLVVGLLICVPALYLNPDQYYRLCMLVFGFFFLILYILSFIYLYFESKEKEDGKFSKTVKGTALSFIVLCVLGYFGYIAAITHDNPFSKITGQVEQWEAFKTKQEKLCNDELPGGMVTGFTGKEQGDIISSLQQKYGKEVLYKVIEKKFLEKDDKNRYFRELTVATAKSGSEEVYVYIYRKYLSENDEVEKDAVILYSSFKSETLKKADVFPQDSSTASEVQNVSEAQPAVNTDANYKTHNCMFDDQGNLLVMGKNGYEPYIYDAFPDIPANLYQIIQVLDEGGNYLKLDYWEQKLFLYYGLEDSKSQIVGGNGIDIFNFNIDRELDTISFSIESLTFHEYLEDDYHPHLLKTFNLLFGESGQKIYDYLMTFYDMGLEVETQAETLIDGMRVTYWLTPKHKVKIVLNPEK
jgi:hypothetical protein